MRNLILATMLTPVLMTCGAAAAASATTDPSSPVTITLSPEQVRNVCENRLPKIERRVSRLLDRINGGQERRGSVEWLRARATTEREAGRETSAQLIEERADRRAGRVGQLNQVRQWAADFRTDHCESK